MAQFWENQSATSSGSTWSPSSSSKSLNMTQMPVFPACKDNTAQKNKLVEEFCDIKESWLVAILDELDVEDPEMINLKRTLLADPINISKIVKLNVSSRRILLKHLLILEKNNTGFVWNLAQRYQSVEEQLTTLPDEHLFGFANNVRFGTFLLNAGFYAEAHVILQIALRQAGTRALELLKALHVILLAESYSDRQSEAFQIISDILKYNKLPEMSLNLKIHVHRALAVNLFEGCQFEAAHREANTAFQLLDTCKSSYEDIISTFRLLGKCCIARQQPYQAKLLLTQAVSWAWHFFGAVNEQYAIALEDYAFYLLTMNAYQDCVKAAHEARSIYFKLYGHLALQPALAQGNLAFRLFLECYEYRQIQRVDRYMEFVLDMDTNRPVQAGTDDRQMLAFKRIIAMIAAANLAQHNKPSDNKRKDELEKVHTRLTLDDIKLLFFSLFVDKRQLQNAYKG